MPSLLTAAEVQSDAVEIRAQLGVDECFAVLFRHRRLAFLVCRQSGGYRVEVKDYSP
ncbi:MAG: hypothetical protein QXT28_09710 [Thermofilaceae archaeon]